MTGSSLQIAQKPRHHNAGLVLIAIYKLLQALFFVAVGVGAMHLVHKDVGDVLAQIAGDLRFNPEGRFVNFVLDRASLLDDPMLRRIGFAAFCYAGVGIFEGIGLYLEKAWGEYLTAVITASFLPLEIHEILRRFTLARVGLLAANVVVLLYLVMMITQRHREHKAPL